MYKQRKREIRDRLFDFINCICLKHTLYTYRYVLFLLYRCLCLAHAGHVGTDKRLQTGRNAILLRQVARGILHALSH